MFEQGQSNKVILYPSHGNAMWGSPPWSCFAILKQCVDTIGKFDENFWPVYHEDYDYMVRMARAGFWQTLIPEAKVQHGWSTGKYEPGMERANKDQVCPCLGRLGCLMLVPLASPSVLGLFQQAPWVWAYGPVPCLNPDEADLPTWQCSASSSYQA